MTNGASNTLLPEALFRILREKDVVRLFFKELAPNDNSKNQIYLGGELSVLNVLPSGEITQETSSSEKPDATGKQRLKASLPMFWLDAEGTVHAAPNAQLILYPQYPEVRLSGFLSGSTIRLGDWFDPHKNGRQPGRVLVFGIARDGRIYSHLAIPDSALAKQIVGMASVATFGALRETPLEKDDGAAKLLNQLCRIHRLGWITGKRLDSAHSVLPCNSQNCGGYTLEAELGITPNGFAEPDFLGWEVKTFSVSNFARLDSPVITLMTPEPDGGIYKTRGVDFFIRKYGYPDVGGQPDRLNFGGVHIFGEQHARTNLQLALTGYDTKLGKITDINGGIALLANNGECAALWSYAKLIDHWKKKHDKAVYVPNISQLGQIRRYCYGDSALLGRGADFETLLTAFVAGDVYYDPGIKMEHASGGAANIKRRSQFRIKARNLKSLYGSFEQNPTCGKSKKARDSISR